MFKEWEAFSGGIWEKEINVRDFIQKNYTPYDGKENSFRDLPRERKTCGSRFWSLQKKSRPREVFWIWIPKSYLQLPPMALVI